MSTTFIVRTDPENPNERVEIRLYSLAEYEADGGIYDDSGNGGEALSEAERAQFLCAARADTWTLDGENTGLAENDILEIAGAPRGTYWLDSATGYFLLREWPAEAPLAARMVNSAFAGGNTISYV